MCLTRIGRASKHKLRQLRLSVMVRDDAIHADLVAIRFCR
jgi:hypothetical protein